jgi:hypothetical protein
MLDEFRENLLNAQKLSNTLKSTSTELLLECGDFLFSRRNRRGEIAAPRSAPA